MSFVILIIYPFFHRVPVDLRSTVYRTAIKRGFYDYADFLWKQYKSAKVTTEKDVILGALGCSRSTNFLEKYAPKPLTTMSGAISSSFELLNFCILQIIGSSNNRRLGYSLPR